MDFISHARRLLWRVHCHWRSGSELHFLSVWVKSFILMVPLMLAFQEKAQSAEPGIEVLQEESSVLPYRTRFLLRSKTLDRSYIVEVVSPQRIPEEAQEIPVELVAAHRLPLKVPVIYALDGGLGVLGEVARFLGFNFAMRPAYVVTIDYPEPWGPGQWRARTHDLLHAGFIENGLPVGGGGADFERFLLDELRPFIEARFPVDHRQSILAGHSLGGLFATAVLIHRPDAFHGFLIASPSVARDPSILSEVQGVARRGTHEIIFISAGKSEERATIRNARRLANALSARGSSLLVKYRVFDGFEHVSSFLPAISEGLPFLLSPRIPQGGEKALVE